MVMLPFFLLRALGAVPVSVLVLLPDLLLCLQDRLFLPLGWVLDMVQGSMAQDRDIFLVPRSLCHVPGILFRNRVLGLCQSLSRVRNQGSHNQVRCILRSILLLVLFLVQVPRVLFYRHQAWFLSPPFFIFFSRVFYL